MIKKITASLLITGSLIFGTMTAYAADISKVTVNNYSTSNEDVQKEISDGISVLPDSVVDYFTATGGKIVLHDGTINYYNNADDALVYGLYTYDDNKITIRITDDLINNPNISIKGSVVHEFGHFLYDEVVPFLSNEDKTTIKNMYNYWSKYMPSCTDENETFAERYKILKIFDRSGFTDEEFCLFKNVEEMCDKLLEYYSENGKTAEYGPGINI